MCERYIPRLPPARLQLRTWPATQACALTGNQTGDTSIHRPALNPLEPHQTGQERILEPILKPIFKKEHVFATWILLCQ